MSIFTKIGKLFGRRNRQLEMLSAARQQAIKETPGTEPVRRFQSARTTRLNKAHWKEAQSQSVNNDLAADLDILQGRCQREYATNPLFEGVVNTFRDDVIGCEGPMLQVVSDDLRFNEIVEAAFKAVMADPDPSHRFGGVEIMKTWVNGLLLAGSYVNVNTTVERDTTPITFGFRTVHARRMVTPPEHAGDPNVAFGCRSDDDGAPVEYYIDATRRMGPYTHTGLEYKTVPAAAVQHCYIPVEAEQLTGYPLMTSTLDTAADLADYDKYVMEAAKAHAAHTPALQAIHPELVTDPEPIASSSYQTAPGEAPVAPLGWGWVSTQSTQPIAQYAEFRHERGAELGRPLHMPMLVVFLTAADANFSSAQYEGTVYCDGVGNIQAFIERRSLMPFANQIVTELELRGITRRPKKYELSFTWNVPAHANIEKFVKAIRAMIEDGLISQAMGSAMLGFDWEKVVASRKRCKEQLAEADLPEAPANVGNVKPEVEETTTPHAAKPKKSNARFDLAYN